MSKKDQLDYIDNLYNKGEISITEAGNRRDELNKLTESEVDVMYKPVDNKDSSFTELTFEDKVLKQLQMQNDKLYTIKAVAVFFLLCSVISIVSWLYILNS